MNRGTMFIIIFSVILITGVIYLLVNRNKNVVSTESKVTLDSIASGKY